MSVVEIRKPQTLLHAVNHHAAELEPLIGAFAISFILELAPLGWTIKQSGTGAQSYSMRKGNKQYHFRAYGGRGKMEIHVNDAYRNGKTVAILKTRVDVMRFVRARVRES